MVTAQAPQEIGDGATTRALAGDSRTIAVWTLASRLTGFVRVATVAAVLGPTYFGNLFQTALFVPYVVGEVLAATLIPAILAPRLVAALAGHDRPALDRLAGGFLGILLPVFGVAAVLILAASPLLLPLLTAAVDDPVVRAHQIALGLPLLATLLPQIPLLAVIGVGIAVQHAHRQYAWPTAAPILENIGLVAVLGLIAVTWGTGIAIEQVTPAEAALLGAGSTLAVALNALAQVAGARRLGVRMWPRAGWRDAEVRGLARIAGPSSAIAGMNSSGLFALMVASGQVPGGAVAFQIACNLFNLPIAMCARPLGSALLPLLSHAHVRRDLPDFAGTYWSAIQLALFLTLPASLLFVGIPQVLAGAVSFGAMSEPHAVQLLAAALAGMGAGIVGEALLIVSTSAAYARRDVGSPVAAAAIRLAVTGAGIALALHLGGDAVAVGMIGVTYAVAAIAGMAFLLLRQRHGLPQAHAVAAPRWASLLATALLATALPTAVALVVGAPEAGPALRIAYAAGLVTLGGCAYLALQRLRDAPEIGLLLGGSWSHGALGRLGRLLGPSGRPPR